MINDNKITINTKEYGHDGLMNIGIKINLFKKSHYFNKTYLTLDQILILLSIDFKFNKGIKTKNM